MFPHLSHLEKIYAFYFLLKSSLIDERSCLTDRIFKRFSFFPPNDFFLFSESWQLTTLILVTSNLELYQEYLGYRRFILSTQKLTRWAKIFELINFIHYHSFNSMFLNQVHENIIYDETQLKTLRLEGNHLLAVPNDFDYMVRSTSCLEVAK